MPPRSAQPDIAADSPTPPGQAVLAPWAADLPSTRITLPSGGWVELRHPSDLRNRHRREVARAVTDDMSAEDVQNMQQALAKVMILDWELPYLDADQRVPSRRDDDVLDELTVADDNEIMRALEPMLDLINPRRVDPADHKDPDSPTAPAAA